MIQNNPLIIFPWEEWHFIYPSLQATVRWGTPGSSANE